MNILYAYNPKTATVGVAKFVLSRYDFEIDKQMKSKALADDFAGAVLDVMTQQTGKASGADLQMLLSAGNTQGDDAGRIEALLSARDQFHAALTPAVKAQLDMDVVKDAPFRELLAGKGA